MSYGERVKVAMNGSKKGWKYIDDDWFRFWYPPETPDDRVGDGDPKETEVHEMCTGPRCAYREGKCPWHPPGCRCSNDACQDDRAVPFKHHRFQFWKG